MFSPPFGFSIELFAAVFNGRLQLTDRCLLPVCKYFAEMKKALLR